MATEALLQAFGLDKLSSSQSISLVIAITVTVTIFVVRDIFKSVDQRRSASGRPWKLPPGPRGWPIFGNVFQLRGASEEVIALSKYGEMTTTHLGSKLWVLLNNSRVCSELLNRHGLVTNERPHLPVASDIISQSNRSVVLPTAEWTERRRVMHQLLSGTALTTYAEYQEMESSQLLAEYLYRPKEWYLHHGRYANSVIHRITLGRRVSRMTKKLATLFRVQVAFILNLPPYNIIDCFPELSKLPKVLQWWRKKAEAIGKETFNVYSAYWAPIRKEIESGTAGASFARDVLTGTEAKYRGNDVDAMFLAIQLVEAGSDTTRATLNIFVMAAICYPETFKKARAEVDSICGSDAERLPNFADEKQMPYVCAMIKELLRWRPIFVWTPEHTSTEDLEFEGYFFPKGTSFAINHLAICKNQELYPDPEEFKPERWLDGHESEILHGLWAFGGGRRVCVGYKLSQRSLFINLARLIYCYDYEAVGPIDNTKLNHHQQGEPFPVLPKVRSANHEALIVQSAEAYGVLKYANGDRESDED